MAGFLLLQPLEHSVQGGSAAVKHRQNELEIVVCSHATIFGSSCVLRQSGRIAFSCRIFNSRVSWFELQKSGEGDVLSVNQPVLESIAHEFRVGTPRKRLGDLLIELSLIQARLTGCEEGC